MYALNLSPGIKLSYVLKLKQLLDSRKEVKRDIIRLRALETNGGQTSGVAVNDDHRVLEKSLVLLKEHGWSGVATCGAAARDGNLEVLRCLRGYKCPWNREEASCRAAEKQHDAVVAWINRQPDD